eukprot:714136-Hanusia_phi.AAC.1
MSELLPTKEGRSADRTYRLNRSCGACTVGTLNAHVLAMSVLSLTITSHIKERSSLLGTWPFTEMLHYKHTQQTSTCTCI